MRLSAHEAGHIKKSFHEYIHFPFKLYLFGSRIDPLKKGGDIDLLVLVEDEQKKNHVV